ncbi:MAG: hypothetical protein ACRERR_06005 [Moraxellaceae bacterium]
MLSLAISLLNGGLGFFSIWFIASHYSLQSYGQYSLVVMTGMWMNMALFSWLRLGLLRYGMSAQERGLIVALYGAMTMVALVVVLPAFLAWRPSMIAVVSVMLAIAIGLYDAVLAWTRVCLNFSSYFLVAFIRPIFFLISLLLIFFLKLRFELVFAILLLSYLLPLAWRNAYSGLSGWRGSALRHADWRGVAKYGLTASFAGTLGYGYFALNKLVVSHFSEAVAFGAFALCADIAFQVISMLFGAFHIRMFSLLLAKHGGEVAQGEGQEFSRYRHVLIALFALLLSASIYYRLAFGALFLKGNDGLGGYLLAWCVLLSGLYFLRVNYLDYMYHFTKRLKSLAASAVVMVVLGGGGALIGFYAWGLKGMLLLSALILLLQNVVVNNYCRRFGVGLRWSEVFFFVASVIAVACLPAASSDILSPLFFIQSVLFVSVFLSVLVFFNILETRKLLLDFLKREP